jgi:hypothetical protein
VTGVLAAVSANDIEPGALGFLIVAAMGVALFFLFRSMNKQLHKIAPDAQSRKQAKSGYTEDPGSVSDGPVS